MRPSRCLWILAAQLAASPIIAAGSATPEDAVKALQQAYLQKSTDGAVAALDFVEEGRQMLQETNPVAANDPEIIRKTAEELERAFRDDLRVKGFPQWGKTTCAFTNKQQIAPGLIRFTQQCTFKGGERSLQNLVVMKRDMGWRVVLPSPVF